MTAGWGEGEDGDSEVVSVAITGVNVDVGAAELKNRSLAEACSDVKCDMLKMTLETDP